MKRIVVRSKHQLFELHVTCVLVCCAGANATLGNGATSRALYSGLRKPRWVNSAGLLLVLCNRARAGGLAGGRQHHHLNLIVLCFGNGFFDVKDASACIYIYNSYIEGKHSQ